MKFQSVFRFNRLVAAHEAGWMGKYLHSINIIGLQHYINNDAPFKTLSNSQMLKLQLFILFLCHCIISTKARPYTSWKIIDHMHASTKIDKVFGQTDLMFSRTICSTKSLNWFLFPLWWKLNRCWKGPWPKNISNALNNLIWKEGLHKLPSVGKQKFLVQKMEWNWTS